MGATHLLLLTSFLDGNWFNPLGNMLDSRDNIIRNRISNLKQLSKELSSLKDESNLLLVKAKTEYRQILDGVVSDKISECSSKLNEEKSLIRNELAVYLEGLERDVVLVYSGKASLIADLNTTFMNLLLPGGP